jgi:signal transduction histidine kinase
LKRCFNRSEGAHLPVNLKDILDDVAVLAARTFPKSIQVTHQAGSDLWPVLGDATHLHQLLMNLCINARDAMPSGGQLDIAASNGRTSGIDRGP